MVVKHAGAAQLHDIERHRAGASACHLLAHRQDRRDRWISQAALSYLGAN
jgi:hypothetical protein